MNEKLPVEAARRAASGKKYSEVFLDGPAGWHVPCGNHDTLQKVEMVDGGIVSRSPWWVDYNHAPPGAGYLHMIFCLQTKGPFGEAITDCAGPNGFVNGGNPRDFTNAELTFRLKGELLERGAQLVLLLQASDGPVHSGWVLKGQPITVTPDWTEQTITAVPDPAQWVCLGGRQSRLDYYGKIELKKVLADVNGNLMLILFPLNVVPMGSISGDRYYLRAGWDYPVWRSELPEGYVMLNKVEINFPGSR